jgi:hypothetical protein
MRNIAWKLIEVMALPLTSTEREIVLGDLIEAQETTWGGMREVSGLVARRQLQLWSGWRPWLAAPGLAFPCSFLLMGFSFGISSELRNHFGYGWQLRLISTEPVEAISLLCQVLVLLICAWAAGFTVESVSRRTSCGQCHLLLSTMFVLSAAVSRGIAAAIVSPALSVSCDRRGLLQQARWENQPAPGSRFGRWQQQSAWLYWQVRGHLWVLNWELIGARVVSGHCAGQVRPNGGSRRNEGIVS